MHATLRTGIEHPMMLSALVSFWLSRMVVILKESLEGMYRK